ncbi:PaaX family transcriptional regulator [Gordonia aichiensis]|uniref:Putative PaaX family transcriptional regulator n=1 Tax=Gordonia aichiensis NBRC 108223 TaxID=1220583 RepID=L7KNB3_9ACTN|nr:PaaX family transcriptional regulator C-terminal domain-containing protein [Gordonia aichiensis]GAC49198.1 putative PaaX family transcriptional regulator [Gordonia aichiensis NBRC 108223]
MSPSRSEPGRGRSAPAIPTPGTAQATLLNIVGDIVHPSRVPVATSVFLAAMAELGHTEPAIRQAIARCAAAGWISKERVGRSTRWALTARGIRLVEDGVAGVEQLSDPHTDWDGRWRILVVTIPNEQRSIRDRVYRALRWDGFGNPLGSVWVSPHLNRQRRTTAAITGAGLLNSTLSFVGTADDLGLSVGEIVDRAWNLDDLESIYNTLIERFERMAPTTDAAHFEALLRLDEELQNLLVIDPHLPRALSGAWTGRQSAERLLHLRSIWHGPAERHWAQLLIEHS